LRGRRRITNATAHASIANRNDIPYTPSHGAMRIGMGISIAALPNCSHVNPAGPCVRSIPTQRAAIAGIAHQISIRGVAWKKTSAKGNDYLSVKLDGPFLPAPINCALVKQTDGYALIWDREKPKADQEAA
jgi:uncharacterized protein (DUF736 family)